MLSCEEAYNKFPLWGCGVEKLNSYSSFHLILGDYFSHMKLCLKCEQVSENQCILGQNIISNPMLNLIYL